ncbi:hypothetical protein [Erythrobacter sp. CCH5-A1]|jgi:hypothetical protein|uniref:hypothetical protein n=1 Tax=Erythrobacter sp. CCH5-A1 TaxID=1768792 RepID=UPI00082975B1|nr:hypothetical protein [Erythrobacter sp. CCH5-A1]
MTAAAAQSLSESQDNSGGSPPAGWEELRADESIQFAPVTIPETPPPKPGWLAELLDAFFKWLAEVLAPVAEMLADSWWWARWVPVALVALFVIVLVIRLIDPSLLRFGRKAKAKAAAAPEDAWRPDAAASLALLEDADRLAAEGRFDEATHLLLQRSVAQISAARPDWVEPSSTARELAALPALPAAAREAFRVIATRVEVSLFALTPLARADWDAARAAYAEFALAKFDRTALAA